jgi:hypothetical protein
MEANAKRNISALAPHQPAPPSNPAPSNGGQTFNSPGRRLSSESLRNRTKEGGPAAGSASGAGKQEQDEGASFDFIRRMKENAKENAAGAGGELAADQKDVAKKGSSRPSGARGWGGKYAICNGQQGTHSLSSGKK